MRYSWSFAAILRRVTAALGSSNTLRGDIMRGGFGAVAVKLAAALANLIVAILLARMLEPEGLGIYAYIFAWISILAIPAQFGLPTLVIRETAKAQAKDAFGLIRSLWKWANRAVYLLSFFLVISAAIFAWFNRAGISPVELATLGFGLLLVPLVALGNLRGASLVGLRHVVIGQLPELLIRPGVFAVLLLVALSIQSFQDLTPANAMGLHAMAAAVALLLAAVALHRLSPQVAKPALTTPTQTRQWSRAALPLGLLAGAQVVVQHTDVLMLGLMRVSGEVGVYKVVLSASSAVAFGLGAVNLVVAPYIARFHAQNDHKKMQRIATLSARASFAFAFPTATLILFYGDGLLAFVFGEAYSPGGLSFKILAIGQLFSATAGSAGVLLNMTGHEKDTLKGIGLAALLNVALNALLIPTYGIVGAATSTCISLVVWNVILWFAAWIRTGVNCSILSFLDRKTAAN